MVFKNYSAEFKADAVALYGLVRVRRLARSLMILV